MKKKELATLYFFIIKKKKCFNDFYAIPACELSQVIATLCGKRVFDSYEISFLEKSGVKIEQRRKQVGELAKIPLIKQDVELD